MDEEYARAKKDVYTALIVLLGVTLLLMGLMLNQAGVF